MKNLKVPNLPQQGMSSLLFLSKSRKLLGAQPRLRAVTVDGVTEVTENQLHQQGGFRVDSVAQMTPSMPRKQLHPQGAGSLRAPAVYRPVCTTTCCEGTERDAGQRRRQNPERR